MKQQKTFTGRSRSKKTRRIVKFTDRAARFVITTGGISTIVAVSLVFVFLAYIVYPLWKPAEVGQRVTYTLDWIDPDNPPLKIEVDEYRLVGWALDQAGMLRVFRLETGELLREENLFPDQKLTAASFDVDSDNFAVGLENGTVCVGTICFETDFPIVEDLDPNLKNLEKGKQLNHKGGVFERSVQDIYRVQSVVASVSDPLAVSGSPIRLVEYCDSSVAGPLLAALDADKQLFMGKVDLTENDFTGETTYEFKKQQVAFTPLEGQPPKYLFLPDQGANLFVLWENGTLYRFDTRDLDRIKKFAESRLTPKSVEVTSAALLKGRITLLVGDSTGTVSAWFRTTPKEQNAGDGTKLIKAHELAGVGKPVTTLASSKRMRMCGIGYENGQVRFYQVTNENLLAEEQLFADRAVELLLIAPKDNEILAVSGSDAQRAAYDPMHAEATLSSLFLPVHYEGREKPAVVWQAQSDEPKFGMWPLVFGTLKATFYSMLIGAPLALLAAIYSSEFMSRSLRSKVKPTIELMASVPSVILGFLAALVLAPFIEQIVPGTLACLLTVPMALLIGAYLWQLLPYTLANSLQTFRLPLMFLFTVGGVLAAYYLVGYWVEDLFFGGNLLGWLEGNVGGATGGWMILFLPLSVVLAALATGRYVNPLLRTYSTEWTRQKQALVSILKFALLSLATLLIAFSISFVIGSFVDPRGSALSYVGVYDSRNALIVGVVMGFAIVPIIYTIADDALTTVPQHLRAGSLGAGATPWQTAVRIIVPTAMSGLFSALMIGLGRAVGETMIVLMAGGNTAIVDMNIFNGFRTLSANIAVEVADAPRGETHYRTLFLAGLVLFLMTFLVNTIAEVVRLRFRKRAYQL